MEEDMILSLVFSVLSAGAATFKVVDFNLLHAQKDYHQRLETTIEGLRNLDPELVFFQEASRGDLVGRKEPSPETIAKKLNYNFVYAKSDGVDSVFGEGLSILTKYPISDIRRKKLAHSAPFIFEQRWSLKVTTQTPWGSVDLFNTHLASEDERELERVDQTLDLLEFIAEVGKSPLVLLGGDFNADTGSLVPSMLSGAYPFSPARFVDTQHFIDPNPPPTIVPENPYQDPIRPQRIDYIFVVAGSPSIIDSFRIFDKPGSNGYFASDHFGVFTKLETEVLEKKPDFSEMKTKTKAMKAALERAKLDWKDVLREKLRFKNPFISARSLSMLVETEYESRLREQYPLWAWQYLRSGKINAQE